MKLLRSFPSISFVQTIGALGLKVPLLLVSVVALAVLAGCGGGDSGSQPSSDDEAFPSSSTLSPLDNPISFLSSSAGEQDIYVVDADGEGLKRLTTDPKSDLEPVWSPDGRSIAFISLRDRNAEIYVMEADGTGLTRLTDTSGEGPVLPHLVSQWQLHSVPHLQASLLDGSPVRPFADVRGESGWHGPHLRPWGAPDWVRSRTRLVSRQPGHCILL